MRVLVVEDDLQLGDALVAGLRQHGHVVDRFCRGEEADAALKVSPYDVAVLDLGLPGGDGMLWLRRCQTACDRPEARRTMARRRAAISSMATGFTR